MSCHIGVVCLTQGKRPHDLARGLDSLKAQQGVELDIVVVGNGWDPTGLPAGVRGLHLSDNLGIPAGRNRGVDQVAGDWIFFLDDDASIPSPTFLSDAVAKFVADPTIGVLQPRVVDAEGKANPRRWIPRIRKGDPQHSSPVFSVWEGAVLMPRPLFDAIGGWGDPYFYAHEGIELAWRVWAAGKRAWYAGDLIANHPAIDPARHSYYYRLNARNRIWLAKRNLPVLLVPIYVASWTAIQIVRSARKPVGMSAWWGGWFAGWRETPGGRRSMSWGTVRRMARAGRPPVI
ncbi:MAG: glycosyltransferase family 2 protein [Rhodoglobus sp.]